MILERTEHIPKKGYNLSDLKTRSRELKVIIRSKRENKISTWGCDVSNNSIEMMETVGADGFYVEVLL